MNGWRLGLLSAFVALGGCITPTEFFNQEFLAQVGLSAGAANLPGEAPAVIVEVENRAGRVVEAQVTWRGPDGLVEERILVIPVDAKVSEAVICPVDEMTLGDVSNPNATGAYVRLGNGGAADPFIAVEAFGVILKEGVNYACGDSVTFTVMPSSQTLSGYQAFAFIRRADTATAP
ncbi:MAG: hypothetical protein HZB38_04390 [Planctomycetes bacterium]|nr:hypothetical protein [Planctomycetota bacterium]